MVSSATFFRSLLSSIRALGLFSENETLEDVSTRDLLYMLVPFAYSEVLGRTNAANMSRRKTVVVETEVRTN